MLNQVLSSKSVIYETIPRSRDWRSREFYACPPSGGEEELDFIPSPSCPSGRRALRASINYDIKYRMGKESLDQDFED
jgi:hypothetical protein